MKTYKYLINRYAMFRIKKAKKHLKQGKELKPSWKNGIGSRTDDFCIRGHALYRYSRNVSCVRRVNSGSAEKKDT